MENTIKTSLGVRKEEDSEFLEGLSEEQLTKNMQTAKTAVVTPSIPPTEEKKGDRGRSETSG